MSNRAAEQEQHVEHPDSRAAGKQNNGRAAAGQQQNSSRAVEQQSSRAAAEQQQSRRTAKKQSSQAAEQPRPTLNPAYTDPTEGCADMLL